MPRVMSTSKKSSSLQLSFPSIGIIGGGFAGLTLANYLLEQQYQCQVLEAKDEPIPIIGTIRLPLAETVLKELHLLDEDVVVNETVSSSSISVDDPMDRQVFLQVLRKRIDIQYSCRVERIDCQEVLDDANYPKKKQYHVYNDQGRKYGPFDYIVAANGLCFHSLPWFQQVSAVVGDVRWQYDTWFWDFGRQRIQRGGNIALADARELAQAFRSMSNGWTTNTHPLLHIPSKFQPQPYHQDHYNRWHSSRVVLLSIMVACLCRMLLTIERI